MLSTLQRCCKNEKLRFRSQTDFLGRTITHSHHQPINQSGREEYIKVKTILSKKSECNHQRWWPPHWWSDRALGRMLLCVAEGGAEVSCSEAVWCLEALGGEGGREGWWSNPSKFAKLLSRVWLLRLRLPQSSAKKYNSFLVNLFVLHWNQKRDLVVVSCLETSKYSLLTCFLFSLSSIVSAFLFLKACYSLTNCHFHQDEFRFMGKVQLPCWPHKNSLVAFFTVKVHNGGKGVSLDTMLLLQKRGIIRIDSMPFWTCLTLSWTRRCIVLSYEGMKRNVVVLQK